ncbi:MAG: sel1 repeat family protein [Betaproteobacteria bacterium]|nr:sel1 repeat family protein [Betaproteobacteria bacterium]
MKRLFAILAMLLLSGAMPFAAHAQEPDYKNLSLPELTRMAMAGDAVAQFFLGVRYESGQSVLRDYRQAVNWFQKAAEQGYAPAQHDLGVMYEDGRGVPQDYRQAVNWYQKAAEQGLSEAQFNLGLMYANGRGVPQDYRQAVNWYQKAAEQGYALAQFNLGAMHYYGQGVPQDIVLAYAFANLAAADGNKTALENQDIFAKEMTHAQIEEGQAIASKWRVGQPLPTTSKTGRAQ